MKMGSVIIGNIGLCGRPASLLMFITFKNFAEMCKGCGGDFPGCNKVFRVDDEPMVSGDPWACFCYAPTGLKMV